MSVNIGYYTKAILGAVIAAGSAVTTSLQDGVISGQEWVAVGLAFVLSGAAVWAVPNVPESVRVYGKAITAGLTSGLSGLGTALTDGVVTGAEVGVLVTALVVGTSLVLIAPNASASDNLIVYADDAAPSTTPLPDDEDLPPSPYDNGGETFNEPEARPGRSIEP